MVDARGRKVKYLLAFLMALIMTTIASADGRARVVRRVYPERPRYAFTPRPYVLGKIGIFYPNDDNPPGGLDGFSSGFFGGFGLGYRSTPFLAIEGEIDFYETDFDTDELSVTPLLLNIRIIFPGPHVEPYLEVGGGIYFAEFEFFNGFFFESDSAAGLGVHLGAGLDFKIAPDFIAGLEFRWFFAEPDFSDAFIEDPNVGGFAVNFLLRALF